MSYQSAPSKEIEICNSVHTVLFSLYTSKDKESLHYSQHHTLSISSFQRDKTFAQESTIPYVNRLLPIIQKTSNTVHTMSYSTSRSKQIENLYYNPQYVILIRSLQRYGKYLLQSTTCHINQLLAKRQKACTTVHTMS